MTIHAQLPPHPRPGHLSVAACASCRRRSELIAALAPAISQLRPFTRERLLDLLGSPEAQLLATAKVERREIPALLHRPATDGALPGSPAAVCRHDPDYPRALLHLSNAPAVLYATCEQGRLRELLAAPTVALIGNRAQTDYARKVSFTLARDLAAAGVTIVSGLNEGLEGTAHRGTLNAGGRSLAVLACAPELTTWPPRDEELHQRIVDRGAALSEFPPGFHPPERWCYIASQRIIAAVARVLVVVETGKRSSALFAVGIALDLGRDIAAVPGRITEPTTQGTFALLRDGAVPVASARDVLELIDSTPPRKVGA